MLQRYRSGLRSSLVLALLPALAAAAPQPPHDQEASPCGSPAHRQFDFWVGDWDVFDARGKKAGTNVIEPILKGCALRESWAGVGGMHGTSLNIYDARDGQWHQTWVDNRGRLLELAGTFRQGSMVLEGAAPAEEPGRVVRHRITWSPLDGGRVRQLWEASSDDGTSWTVLFDGTYVPRGSGG
jgi:hypothetical protein